MPALFWIFFVIALVGSTIMIVHNVRTLTRRRRNLRHYEKGEPLERVGELDDL